MSTTKSFKITLFLLVGMVMLIFLCFASISLMELPRFLILSLPPPEDYRGDSWFNTTYSVITRPSPYLLLQPKHFTWRQETVVFYNEEHGIVSWDSIVNYFDDKLSKLGWKRYPSYPVQPCMQYLPEAHFLEPGENGYVTYLRNDYQEEFSEQPLVCLAVWLSSTNDDGTPYAFEVVLLTSKPSPLSIVGESLDLP